MCHAPKKKSLLGLVKTYGSNYETDFSDLVKNTELQVYNEALDQLRWIAKDKPLELSPSHCKRLQKLIEEGGNPFNFISLPARTFYRARRNYLEKDPINEIEWDGMVRKLKYLLSEIEKGTETPHHEIADWTQTEQELIAFIQDYFFAEASYKTERW